MVSESERRSTSRRDLSRCSFARFNLLVFLLNLEVAGNGVSSEVAKTDALSENAQVAQGMYTSCNPQKSYGTAACQPSAA